MLIETAIENRIISAIRAVLADQPVTVIGARQVAASGYVKGKTEANTPAVVAVATGFRKNDAFSLSPISISVAVSISSRVETDPTGGIHEKIMESVANLLQTWHDDARGTEKVFDGLPFHFGEIRLDGGAGKSYDDSRDEWTESVSFAIRGAMKKGN